MDRWSIVSGETPDFWGSAAGVLVRGSRDRRAEMGVEESVPAAFLGNEVEVGEACMPAHLADSCSIARSAARVCLSCGTPGWSSTMSVSSWAFSNSARDGAVPDVVWRCGWLNASGKVSVCSCWKGARFLISRWTTGLGRDHGGADDLGLVCIWGVENLSDAIATGGAWLR